ncbi:MAG TPA: pyroglutamyl-peptidase I [Candidatus Limnocylindria bacterium]|nr:pyroglutamyl-peptidase I [Candidatus Limnocylindria bacterium]
MTKRDILLTGFEPFGSYAVNPSAEVAKALDGLELGDRHVRSLVLPVHHAGAAAAVARAMAEVEPAAVVHLGLAGGRARIALERVAVNVMDYELPDVSGYRATGEPCVPGGPAAYLSTLPLEAMLEALTAAGIPAYLSNTAGTYLCNQTMYTTRHAIEGTGHGPAAGFIHLPLLPAMVAASGLEQASMDLPLMLRAVEVSLGVIARGRS